jgi:hypothetical protein
MLALPLPDAPNFRAIEHLAAGHIPPLLWFSARSNAGPKGKRHEE